MQVICWNKQHTFFSYFVAAPSIVVWGLGIPFFALVLLTRLRKNLDVLETREKYGFLYRGYRKEFYFWEIIIMYRKIALIFIAVFISAYGTIAQALIVFLFLIIFLLINIKHKPYSTETLNDLELMSLITSMITIYCGLFYLSEIPEELMRKNPDVTNGLQLSEDMKLFFFAAIIIANLFFFIYWGYKMYQEVKSKFRNTLP